MTKLLKITTTRYDVPQIVAPHNDEEAPPLPRRRASFLPRSDAIETPYPRKQNSSPLPQHKIYERGHIYSRSWNAEFYDENEDRQYRQRYAEDIRIEDPRRYYHSGGQSSHSKLPPPLPPPPIPSHMLVPPQITFTRQTKSFDSPNSTSPSAFSNDLIPSSPTQRYPLSLERRSFSERDRQQQQQQHHHQINRQTILQPTSEVSRECQGLWQARNVLEFTSPQNLSTDLSDDGPSVISTSFESNTESLHLGDSKQKIQTSKGKPLLDLPRQSSNADTKRQKYRSLLEYRQLQRTCPETNSFESATSDSTSKFGSSLDSANSEELKKQQPHKPKGPRYRSMMHLTRKPTNLQKTIAKRTFSAKYIATKSLIRPFFNQEIATGRDLGIPVIPSRASCEIQRDYSVDIKSDSLFRDFVRVDPRFENSKSKPVQIDYPKGFKPAPRRRSSQIMLAMAQYRSADNATFQYQQHQQHFQPNLRLPASPEIKGSHHNIYPY
uniref:Uncharacterized protein n=1 Tax=Panagrolaimus sp. PS1159 TaxID=55785 RepID=A0AC35FPJ3_9BILA